MLLTVLQNHQTEGFFQREREIERDEQMYCLITVKRSKAGMCFRSNTLSLTISAILTDVSSQPDIGIGIGYRYYGSLFNLRRLQAKTMMFADGFVLNATSGPEKEFIEYTFSESYSRYRLTISVTKIHSFSIYVSTESQYFNYKSVRRYV